VESNPKAVACITDNIEHTHFTDKAVVLKQDVFAALRGSIREHIDVIFMDPPYNQEYEKRVLEILKDASYVDEDTLIVVEASLETSFDYVEDLGFAVEKEKKYKTNKHMYIKKI
jgi:16S rRNA (guanine966-N2)-methyltransferase